MRKPFKYHTSFDGVITASNNDEDHKQIIQASLNSLKSLNPNTIDLESNIDLLAIAFNAAVVNVFNKNHDGMATSMAKKVYSQFVHKPTNIEHKKEKVVGHIISAGFSKYGSNEIINEEDLDEDDLTPFNIALSSVVYKTVQKDFADLLEKSLDPSSPYYQKISASWEVGFNDYVIAVGSKNLQDAEIIYSEKQIEEFNKYLKAFDGEGMMDDGTEVYRLISGDVYPLGIGFTTNPAADVEGLIQLDNKKKEPEGKEDNSQDEENSIAYERDKIEINSDLFLNKLIKNKKKSSHKEKDVVISDNDKFNSYINQMEMKELINELKETIQASTSDKFSEEAVANVVKVVTEAIKDRSESYVKEKAELEKQQAAAEAAKQESEAKVTELESNLAETLAKLSNLEAEVQAAKDLQLFNDRMESLDSEYELSDADRKIIASDIKDLDSAEESFAAYQERMAVVYSHKSKKFIEDQEKQFNEKLEAAVKAKIEASEKTTEEVVEEKQEDVEEVLDQVEASEEIPSNNGDSTDKEISLKEKFEQAFSKESITIKY